MKSQKIREANYTYMKISTLGDSFGYLRGRTRVCVGDRTRRLGVQMRTTTFPYTKTWYMGRIISVLVH